MSAFLESATRSKYQEHNLQFKIHFIKASVDRKSLGSRPNGIQIQMENSFLLNEIKLFPGCCLSLVL
jgi:hypothetical protein